MSFTPILFTVVISSLLPSQVDIQAILKAEIDSEKAAAILELKTNKLWTVGENHLNKLHRPGSVYKMVSAASLLNHGLGNRIINCHGEQNFHGQEQQRCWHSSGHGKMDLKKAIINSCNIYFYSVASELPANGLWEQMNYWSLDRPSGFSYKEEWPVISNNLSAVENGDCAIGDCDRLLVSGFNLLRLAALLSRSWPQAGNIDVPEELGQAMFRVVEQGTAAKGKSKHLSYAGKTGTARRVGSYRYEGWFIGFFPFEKPQYALVVYDSKGQGKDSARIADRLIGAIYDAAGLSR